MRAKDWSATPLGPPEFWPEALKVALRILLTSRFEMWLGWGPDIAFFYNDAYRPTLGNKHPRSLAMPAAELWSEIWDDVGPLMRKVYDEGASTWSRAMMLLLERRGFSEETYHTFSYSPLIGDKGEVEGLFCAVSEETDRVIELGPRQVTELQLTDLRSAPALHRRFDLEPARRLGLRAVARDGSSPPERHSKMAPCNARRTIWLDSSDTPAERSNRPTATFSRPMWWR